MNKFIAELRRRSVFRVAGLYVGVAWIFIEASSVLLPTFEAPDWVLRWIIILAFIGFPVALVLAWVYEFTAAGIVRDEELPETEKSLAGSRVTDFIAIGVLSVALIFSVYLNITGGAAGTQVEETMEPVSVLIADFDNRTGNPVFDGALEQALNIGIESAAFITSFPRNSALSQAKQLGLGEKLDGDLARLLSVRQGIDLALIGSVVPDGSGFEISVEAVDPSVGETVASASVTAKSTAEVLAAVGSLSEKIREELGDDSIGRSEAGTVETFTAASLEAAKAYSTAQKLALAGNHEEALQYYESAVDQDPNFGRALSGWALSLFYLGRKEEAEALWERALSKMDTMTERERYRTLGLYYMVVTGNYEKAKESYETLVAQYPADGPGHNNLAIAHFATLDFDAALEEGRKVLDIYPTRTLFRSNYALYAMYAGDFETAEAEARKTLEQDPTRRMAWLPVAMAALARDEYDAARDAYRQMAAVDTRGESVASLGLADIEMYLGNFAEAADILVQGIAGDAESGNTRGQATKLVALGEARAALGQNEEAADALSEALKITGGLARQVPAALTWVEIGETGQSAELAAVMGDTLQAQSRAYSLMIEAQVLLAQQTNIKALDKLREALAMADLWLIRFHLAQAYMKEGYAAEALDEVTICETRRGEATALFLDDLPTWRYMATLPYWKGRAQQQLGIEAAARENLQAFLSLRPDGGPLAEDARGRVE